MNLTLLHIYLFFTFLRKVDMRFSYKKDQNMTRRGHTAESKKEAARMIIIGGTSVLEVAQKLGAGNQILDRWKQPHLDKLEIHTIPGAPSPKATVGELAELGKELAKSRRMNENSKKTVGYFSRDDYCNITS